MYRHYITIDDQNRITNGWSTGEHPGLGPGEHDLLLTDQGGIKFRLFPDGEDNPPLKTEDGIPLYKWERGLIIARSEEEIDGDRPGPVPDPEPTELEKLRADVDFIMVMEELL